MPGGKTGARITNEKNTADGFNMFNKKKKKRHSGDFMSFFIEQNKRLRVVATAWRLTFLMKVTSLLTCHHSRHKI